MSHWRSGHDAIKALWSRAFAVLAGLGLLVWWVSLGAQQNAAQEKAAPKFKFDPDWPKPLPNKWKLGGVTGFAVDKDDNVWVLNRPNDLTDIELEAELTPPLADCCVRPPSMIHIDKNGNVIGSFDAPQGHGMAVDSKGFVYIGQDTVRKYDPKTGKVVGEVPRAPEKETGGAAGAAEPLFPNTFRAAAAPGRSRDFSLRRADALSPIPRRRRLARRRSRPSAPNIPPPRR